MDRGFGKAKSLHLCTRSAASPEERNLICGKLIHDGVPEFLYRTLTGSLAPSSLELLGWSDFFADQVEPSETELLPRRIASVHRARVDAIDVNGPVDLELPPNANTAEFAVGDWVLADP